MRKQLLTLLLAVSSLVMMAAPEGRLYLSGLNGLSGADPSLGLDVAERSEDDIDEGIYRWINNEFSLTEAGAFTVINIDGTFSLGYDAGNLIGASNSISITSPMMYLIPGTTQINCNLEAGRYKVVVVLFEADAEDPESTDTWMISFTPLDTADDKNEYYLLGFNNNTEPSATNKFVKTVTSENGETVTTFSIPKFYVGECPDGFRVYDEAGDIYYGGSGELSDSMPYIILEEGGSLLKSSIAKGYYSVNFVSTAGLSMISFIRCEDQNPADQSQFYLLGFNGFSEPSDAVKFVRTVESYYDEEEEAEITSVSYKLNNFNITSCPDGFTVATSDGSFRYGIDVAFSAMLGTSVSSGFGFLGIYGQPMGWAMDNGEYNVIFTLTSDTSAMISFLPVEEGDSVERIDVDESNVQSEYFNVYGIRIAKPAQGFCIERRGDKVVKRYIR